MLFIMNAVAPGTNRTAYSHPHDIIHAFKAQPSRIQFRIRLIKIYRIGKNSVIGMINEKSVVSARCAIKRNNDRDKR